MLDVKRYKIGLRNTITALEEDTGKLPKSLKDGITYGYHAAAGYWHNKGLEEGWNDHIKKLNQIMKLLVIEERHLEKRHLEKEYLEKGH